MRKSKIPVYQWSVHCINGTSAKKMEDVGKTVHINQKFEALHSFNRIGLIVSAGDRAKEFNDILQVQLTETGFTEEKYRLIRWESMEVSYLNFQK